MVANQHNGSSATRIENGIDSEGNAALLSASKRLEESFTFLTGLVDSHDALLGPDGTVWNELSGAVPSQVASGEAYRTEHELQTIRNYCRHLAVHNEFAINGQENRISYIVGAGHIYTAVARQGADPGADLVDQVQKVLDEFVRVNQWHRRQQEIVRRNDRDGETFLRLFEDRDHILKIRFVEPGQIAAPSNKNSERFSFGIETEPDDAETPVNYWIDGRAVAARRIQHRKQNVDVNSKRGLPTFWPVRSQLARAEKIMRNMAATVEIQAAFALVRRHTHALKTTVQTLVSRHKSAEMINPATGETTALQQFKPGTILDASAGIDYEFPAQGLDPSRPVHALQAILRAVASRLVMPEFMLTSDASNANYSSTLVAEGPAVKMFERMQAEQIEFDREIVLRAMGVAIGSGKLPKNVNELIHIQIEPPKVAMRDQLEETQRERILYESGVLSAQTWAAREGLSYSQEQRNIKSQQTATTAEVGKRKAEG